ncbi:MAG: hypothetical protein O3A00_20355 [Planctomycetota bacterium]|nr:hypothetical protein [Planctomycetota bacterium]
MNMNMDIRGVLLAVLATLATMASSGCSQTAEPPKMSTPDIEGEARHWTFTADDVDTVPRGWEVAQTGEGDGSVWKVVADESAPSESGYVLAQSAESPRSMFNLCAVNEASYQDMKLSVAFRSVAGKVDQGGGFVWRYVDANHYYVCRFNPLEDNLRIYKVIVGKRTQLASVDVELAGDGWHTLTVAMLGDLIVCDVDGTQLSVRDETLSDAGRVGLWTKADAQTHFDQFTATGSE